MPTCRIIGMNNLEEVAAGGRAPHLPQQAVLAGGCASPSAGSTMHFLIALVLLFGLFAFDGQRQQRRRTSAAVDGSATRRRARRSWPACRRATGSSAVDGIAGQRRSIRPSTSIQARPGRDASPHRLERDGQTFETHRHARPTTTREGERGRLPRRRRRTIPYVSQSIPSAAADAVTEFGTLTWASVAGARIVLLAERPVATTSTPCTATSPAMPARPDRGRATASGDRPLSAVGAVRLASQAAEAGVPELLLRSSSRSTSSSGIFNLVPLLPLDGGHVAIAHLREASGRGKGKRYHADVAKLMPLTYAVVMLHAVLFFVSSLYLDLADPICGTPSDSERRRYPRRTTRQILVGDGRRRRRRADHGAVDDDHQDGRRRRHARSRSTRSPPPAATSCAAPATRPRRPRAWPRSCPARRCRSSPTSTSSTSWRSRRSRPACTACASTPATSASPSTSSSSPSEAKDRGVPIRIGVNGGSLDPDAVRAVRRPITPEAMVESALQRARPTSTRSASTTSRSR